MSNTNSWLMLVATTLLTVAPAAAQTHATDKGSVQLTGSASFTSVGSDDDDDDRLTTIALQPGIRYFVIPGLAVGADLQLSRTSRGESTSSSYGIGPAVTYYFGGATTKTHPYLGATVQWSKHKFDAVLGESEETTSGFGASAGVLFLLSSSVGINTELFYRNQSFDNTVRESSTNMYGLAIGIAAFIF